MPEVRCSLCGATWQSSESAAKSGTSELCPACREKSLAEPEPTASATVFIPPLPPRPKTARDAVPEPMAPVPAEEPAAAPPSETSDSTRPASRGSTARAGVLRGSSHSSRPIPGRMFGSYEILGEISRGSFGVVYKARQPGLDRLVALKVLLAGEHASDEAVARFQREARAAARIKHPNIVPIYDIGECDGHHYFAMEFVEGEPLSKASAGKRLSIREALALMETLADAIQAAHEGGVIHRDIKPSNVLLDARGVPHITDFGLAKQVDLDTRYTHSGTTLGTPAYMPPEQARGEIDQIDARSDVYALGAVLYELLTGGPPFAGRSLLEVVVAVLNEPARPPRQLNVKIHRDVQTIVLKCLEKDPRNRYASAAELRDDIRRFRSGEAIRARPVGSWRLAGRFVQRHAFFLLAAATVLLVVGASIWQIRRIQDRAREERETAQREQEVRRRADEERDRQANVGEMKRFWWTPLAPGDRVPDEEIPLFQRGFVPGAHDVLDFVDGRRQLLTRDRQLVSPEPKRIFGDLEAKVRFRLNKEAAAVGARIGLLSWEGSPPCLPYVLDILPGRLALIAPQDLYARANDPGQLLQVKAEKTGPRLEEGAYQLTIRREGMFLDFRLLLPSGAPAGLSVWDVGLSHWKFKNTQLTVRDPAPGFQLVSAEVLWKSPPKRLDDLNQALRDFQNGDYNGARDAFLAIADARAKMAPAELRKAAQALYYVGLVEEICHPGETREMRRYAEALDVVAQCPPGPERNTLEAQIRLRRLVRTFQQALWGRGDWEDVDVETKQVSALQGALAPPNATLSGLGEPFAWELQPTILSAVERQDEPTSGRALALFKLLGLPPGSTDLDRAAGALGRRLASANRQEDLLALHRRYPAPQLGQAFVDLIHRGVVHQDAGYAFSWLRWAEQNLASDALRRPLAQAGSELLLFCLTTNRFDVARELLTQTPPPAYAAAFGQALGQTLEGDGVTPQELEELHTLSSLARKAAENDTPAATALSEGLTRLAQGLASAGRAADLRKLQAAWPEVKLSAAFAQCVTGLAISNDPRAEDEALGLLRYAHQTFPNDEKLALAAHFLASRKAVVDEQKTYLRLLTIQDAYPRPELLPLAEGVLSELVRTGRTGEAAAFYGAVRRAFGRDAARLAPLAVAALLDLPPPVRDDALTGLRAALPAGQEDRPAAMREWRLEIGDLLLALGETSRAAQSYQEVHGEAVVELEGAARAALRLSALALLKPADAAARTALDPWRPVADSAEAPLEGKLAARYLKGELDDTVLAAELAGAGGPRLFTPAEWDVVRALRHHLRGESEAASASLQSAARQAEAVAGWPFALAKIRAKPAPGPQPVAPLRPSP